MAGVFIARTPTFFFLLSPSIESFVAPLKIAILWLPWVPSRAQLANELLSNLHHAARAQHECSTAVDLSYVGDVESMDFNTTFDGRKCDHTTRIPLCCKTPLERTLGELPLSVLCAKSEHACESLRFAWSSGDLRWGIDERKQRWRRRRSRKGKNSWWGHFCQIMRQRNEKGLQSTTRKDLRRAKTKRHNVPDSRRALHMHDCTRTRLRHPRSLHATWLCNMCKYAERCGDRGPVTIPGHDWGEEESLKDLGYRACTLRRVAKKCVGRSKWLCMMRMRHDAMSGSRRSRPSVSKVISQPRSLGDRRPVDRAAGAALRLIDLPPELTMFFFFCLRSNDRTKTGVCLLSFLLRSLRLTKIVLKPKKKGHASALPASVAGSSYLSSSKVKNKDRWTTNGIDRTVSVEHTERPSSRKAWIEREGHFPCPAHGTGLWQTFKPQLSFQSRTSKPDCTWTPTSTGWEILRTRCKQSSISFSKDEALRKIKELFSLCLWPQSLFSFDLSFFSRFTVALSNSKQTWPRARKNWKSPDVQKLALVPPLARLVPPLAQVGFADLLLFVTLPIFFLERRFLHQNKAWRLGFSKHPPKRKFPHRNDL